MRIHKFLLVILISIVVAGQSFAQAPAKDPKDKLFGSKLPREDRKSTRLNSSHLGISYAVFCLKKKRDPLSSKVRIVCGLCNSGWMSQLQNEAKPSLIPLFQRNDCTLQTEARTCTSHWLVVYTM